jgi:hypothetical protein
MVVLAVWAVTTVQFSVVKMDELTLFCTRFRTSAARCFVLLWFS